MIASASPPCSPAHIASNTSLAILPEIVPSTMRCEQARRAPRGGHRRAVDVDLGPVERRGELAQIQLAASLVAVAPPPSARTTSSK